jgi:regulator of protease activity HflC (stomatin/prohibitin superfamily)
VWRVTDTAQAVFDVDDYKEFVNIQIEAGLRTVGSRHPYDDMSAEDTTTLRGSADVVNAELIVELNDRLRVAGITVDEAGLTHLAYAAEIAGAMLRRQQADAVIVEIAGQLPAGLRKRIAGIRRKLTARIMRLDKGDRGSNRGHDAGENFT